MRSAKKTKGSEEKSQELLDDDIEVDALGIPMVELSKKHDTDVGKSNARKRRKTRGVQKVAPARNTRGVLSIKNLGGIFGRMWKKTGLLVLMNGE
ncbi:hypothetical protein BDN72DRAFT_842145 [Pluteus cervinus]|uniref:Uncharacterized protein n=1 Tax=Pluteus cervinus TaxID=181527 RepID=A0ACD3ARH4_9AGAR|nr:hypothetical protein BDN72DRAFT_842145 [Pluteus cervinus]